MNPVVPVMSVLHSLVEQRALRQHAISQLGPDADPLLAGLLRGERRSLSRAITLVESSRSDHRARADALIESVLPYTGHALRVGITGTPGVGKSSFLEALGLLLVKDPDVNLAILAIDPSSPIGGGSILGDKTRMQHLSVHPQAFIRPSPSGGHLGGVARRTREALLLAEAAGFSVIFIETVGVGQSEAALADLVDTFVLLLHPGGGDDLQGVKRGVLELADVVVVNKADGALRTIAERTRVDYQHGLHFFPARFASWRTPVLLASALTGDGLPDVWQTIQEHRHQLDASGVIEQKRAQQAERWLYSAIDEGLRQRFYGHPAVCAALSDLVVAVRAGQRTPHSAALALLALGGKLEPNLT